jgi:hypothetical protein
VSRFENALVSRTAISLNRDQVAITEIWDVTYSDSPFVPVSRDGVIAPYPHWRVITMSQREFAQMNPPLR